ncbi:hypothetical protein HKX48_006447 [Thoreauomyces humboldtii]|nr:hypothetical protein HKX48_006447 [Thoreauomyces humboldtii]
MSYMLTLQPCPPNHHTTLFRRARLTAFANGDPKIVGIPFVFLHFFSSAKRVELVNSIMLHHALEPTPGYANRMHARNTIRDLLEDGVYDDWYAVHDADVTISDFGKKQHGGSEALRERLFEVFIEGGMATLWKGFITRDNVDLCREYVGEQIAFFFDFMAFYTIWTVPAAAFGFVVFAYGAIRAVTADIQPAAAGEPQVSVGMARMAILFDNTATIIFALGMSIWATLFIEFWKRRQRYLAYVWDVSEYRRDEQVRPQWEPSRVTRNPYTRRIERSDPFPHRIIRRAGTGLVLVLCTCALLAIVAGLVGYKAWGKDDPKSGIAGWAVDWVGGGALEIAQVLIVQKIYFSIAGKINEVENFKYDSQFEDGLIFKTFLFNFVNNYAVFVWIGIIKAMLGRTYVFGKFPEKCNPIALGTTDDSSTSTNLSSSCIEEMTFQLAIIFVGLQFARMGQKVLIPALVQASRKAIKRFPIHIPFRHHTGASKTPSPTHEEMSSCASPPSTQLLTHVTVVGPVPVLHVDPTLASQYALDQELFSYDDWVLCEDFGMAVVQFGYIALFSCAFPLAPCFAILGNVVGMRVDSFKMLVEYRRPWAQRAQSIGLWTSALTTVSTISAPINALIIAFSSSTFSTFASTHFPTTNPLAASLAFVVIFEHLILLIKAGVAAMVPPTPGTVKRALRREAYLGRNREEEEEAMEDEEEEEWEVGDVKRHKGLERAWWKFCC